MKKYIYIDHNIEKIIFTIEANDIMIADKEFKSKIGYDVTKKPFIGCQIKEL